MIVETKKKESLWMFFLPEVGVQKSPFLGAEVQVQSCFLIPPDPSFLVMSESRTSVSLGLFRSLLFIRVSYDVFGHTCSPSSSTPSHLPFQAWGYVTFFIYFWSRSLLVRILKWP
jgi:hypothetical protein